MRIRRNDHLIAALFLLLLPGNSYAEPGDIKVVHAVGKAILGDDTTQAQAKSIALNNARRSALEEAVGVNLHSTSLVYNGELISELINAATKGLIIKQTIKEDVCGEENGKLYCSARIEAHVKPLNAERNRRINILKATVQRPDKDASSTLFQNNDEIQVRVTANEDSFINIFSVDQYGNIIKIFPNEYVKSEPVQAQKTFVFPDNTLRSRGLKLRVVTPGKLTRALESVLVIATKEERHFLSDATVQNPTITDLMKELSEIEDSPWGERAVGYEVRK